MAAASPLSQPNQGPITDKKPVSSASSASLQESNTSAGKAAQVAAPLAPMQSTPSGGDSFKGLKDKIKRQLLSIVTAVLALILSGLATHKASSADDHAAKSETTAERAALEVGFYNQNAVANYTQIRETFAAYNRWAVSNNFKPSYDPNLVYSPTLTYPAPSALLTPAPGINAPTSSAGGAGGTANVYLGSVPHSANDGVAALLLASNGLSNTNSSIHNQAAELGSLSRDMQSQWAQLKHDTATLLSDRTELGKDQVKLAAEQAAFTEKESKLNEEQRQLRIDRSNFDDEKKSLQQKRKQLEDQLDRLNKILQDGFPKKVTLGIGQSQIELTALDRGAVRLVTYHLTFTPVSLDGGHAQIQVDAEVDGHPSGASQLVDLATSPQQFALQNAPFTCELVRIDTRWFKNASAQVNIRPRRSSS